MADLRDCTRGASAMTDPAALRRLCLDAVAAAQLTPVGELFHRFADAGGVTGVVLLAESHLAVHTWPELGAVTLDVYVCNFGGDNTAKAERLLADLEQAFGAQATTRHRVLRGEAAVATEAAPAPAKEGV